MEKVTYGQSVEKGDIVEINIPNENPIKAVVLDIIQNYFGENYSEYTHIMYTQDNRLIRAQQWYSQDVIEECSEEGEIIGGYECEEWSPIQYDGTIIDHCEIPQYAKLLV